MAIKTYSINQPDARIHKLRLAAEVEGSKFRLNVFQMRDAGNCTVTHGFQKVDGLERSSRSQCFANHGLDGGNRDFLAMAVEDGLDRQSFVPVPRDASVCGRADAINFPRRK